eukprot:GHVN01071060.1.p1 GENE.GHVN01071060.1~~GHVN01071060.1.p1  ORF type:complete len:276 (+),score=35.99 GHVN01071060.1:2676-3503(+)
MDKVIWVLIEWVIRVILYGTVLGLNLFAPPPIRYTADWSRYSYPMTTTTKYPWQVFSLFTLTTAVGLTFLLAQDPSSVSSAKEQSKAETHKFNFWRNFWKRSYRHQAYLSLTMAICLSLLVVEVLKISTGGLRPDYLHRCFGPDPLPPLNEIPAIPTCPYPKADREGRKSFPSGHTNLAACVGGWLGLLTAKRMRFLDSWLPWASDALQHVFLLYAVVIGASRITDYRHHIEDVTVGGVIGLCAAHFAWWSYFPERKQDRGGSELVNHVDDMILV